VVPLHANCQQREKDGFMLAGGSWEHVFPLVCILEPSLIFFCTYSNQQQNKIPDLSHYFSTLIMQGTFIASILGLVQMDLFPPFLIAY